VTVLPVGMISLPDALEQLMAAIHGDWAVAPAKNHQVHAGEIFKDCPEDATAEVRLAAPEIQLAVITFERDGHKTTSTEDEARWTTEKNKIRDALAKRTLVAQMEFDERLYDVTCDYWTSFFEELTFYTGEYRADPDDRKHFKFNEATVFINEVAFNAWLSIGASCTQPHAQKYLNSKSPKRGRKKGDGAEDDSARLYKMNILLLRGFSKNGAASEIALEEANGETGEKLTKAIERVRRRLLRKWPDYNPSAND
jgi:hypothetical protein